jgi:hypothetical protein
VRSHKINRCEIIADKLGKAGWSWSCSSQQWIAAGEPIWIVDAHRSDGKRFIIRADELLTAFLELESAVRTCREFILTI